MYVLWGNVGLDAFLEGSGEMLGLSVNSMMFLGLVCGWVWLGVFFKNGGFGFGFGKFSCIGLPPYINIERKNG